MQKDCWKIKFVRVESKQRYLQRVKWWFGNRLNEAIKPKSFKVWQTPTGRVPRENKMRTLWEQNLLRPKADTKQRNNVHGRKRLQRYAGDICAFNLIMIIKFGKIKITNSQGIHGVPNGYISCEGRCCQEAYEMYIEEWTE